MKPLLLLLALSLIANALLLATRRGDAPAKNISSAALPPDAAAASHSVAAPVRLSTMRTGPHAEFWRQLAAGDASAVDRLRAAGWPEDAVRDIVLAVAQDAFRDRFSALWRNPQDKEYWRVNTASPEEAAARRKAGQALNQEMRALIRTLLGPDFVPERRWDEMGYARFTPAQAEAIRLINEDYNALTAEVHEGGAYGRSILLPEDREKLAYLEQERAADIAKILPPSEIIEYELRHSPAAATIRRRLAGFRPTEEEFRALFPLQKAALEKAGIIRSPQNAVEHERLTAAQSEMDEAVKALLTPERYDDYVRAKDYDYTRLVALTERLQLPPAAANAAHAVKADFEKRARAIRPTPGPDAAERAGEAYAELHAEAQQRLVEILGERGLEAYKANGAFWLNNPTPNISR